MSLEGRILSRARDKHSAKINAREIAGQRRRAEIFRRIPELGEIESKLKTLVIDAIAAALKNGGDPEEQIDKIGSESLDLQQKRAELLVSHGYPIDFLDEDFLCEKCRDTGYLGLQICSCLKDIYNMEMSRELSSLLNLSEETFDSFDLRYYSSVKDPVTGASPLECMETIFAMCKKFAYRFGPHSVNLLFQGGPGLGKTFLSSCIARVVAERGFSVVYDTVVSVLETYEIQKFAKSQDFWEESSQKALRYMECDLFILDDLGTEMSSSFTNSSLYTLINSRLIRGKATIISTNLSSAEFERRYPAPILSRLEGEYQCVNFVGSDIRLLKKEGRFT